MRPYSLSGIKHIILLECVQLDYKEKQNNIRVFESLCGTINFKIKNI